MMQQPVKNCRCNHRVTKHTAPFADRTVRGDQDRAFLVTARYQLEEQVGGVGLKGQVTQLVNDQKLGPAELRQLLFKQAVVVAENGGAKLGHGSGGMELLRAS